MKDSQKLLSCKDATRGMVRDAREALAPSVNSWCHPELAMVGMPVLCQLISASSCERKWSAHEHIQTKIHNKLSPETTEKLVYVYSNSKMAATVCNAYELKMFAWDNEDV